MTAMCDRRRKDDPQTVWDSIVSICKQCAFWIGLLSTLAVVCFGAGYWVGSQGKTVIVNETPCGSCKKGDGK